MLYCVHSGLTEALFDPGPGFPPSSSRLQTRQTPDFGETQLLVDEEEEEGKGHDKDPHGRQEADGLWGDWQHERTHNDTAVRPDEQTT